MPRLDLGLAGLTPLARESGPTERPVVEVDHHGGRGGGGEEEVAEAAEGVAADGVALVGGGVPLVGIFGCVDVEVVEPEVGHDLEELALGEDGAEEFRFGELAEEVAGAAAGAGAHEGEELALAGVELGEKKIFLIARDVAGEGDAIGDGELEEGGHAGFAGKCVEIAGDVSGGGLIEFFLLGLGLVGEGELRVGELAVGKGLFLVEFVLVSADDDLVGGGELGIGGEGALPFGDLLDEAAVGKGGEGVGRLEVEGGVVGEALGEDGIGDGAGVELRVDPGVGADGDEAVEVTGTGTEGEAVEELEGALAGGERGGCRRAGRGRGGGRRRGAWRFGGRRTERSGRWGGLRLSGAS